MKEVEKQEELEVQEVEKQEEVEEKEQEEEKQEEEATQELEQISSQTPVEQLLTEVGLSVHGLYQIHIGGDGEVMEWV